MQYSSEAQVLRCHIVIDPSPWVVSQSLLLHASDQLKCRAVVDLFVNVSVAVAVAFECVHYLASENNDTSKKPIEYEMNIRTFHSKCHTN